MNLYKSAPAFLTAVALLFISCSKKEDPAAQLPPPPAKADSTATADPELKPIQAVNSKLNNSNNASDPFAKSAAPSGKGSFVIQVDIKPSQNAADKVVEKLGANAIQAYVAEVENPGELEGTYYRVRIGFFSSIAEATNYAKATLAPLGYAWWVDHKKNDAVGNPSAAATVNQAPSVPATDWQQSAPTPQVDTPVAQPTPTPEAATPTPEPAPAVQPTAAPAPQPAASPAPATAPAKDEWQ